MGFISHTLKTINKTIYGAINELFDSSQRMYPNVFPLNISLSGPTLFKKGTTQSIKITWSIKEGNEEIVPKEIILSYDEINTSLPVNNKEVTIPNVTKSTIFNFKVSNSYQTVSQSIRVNFVSPSYFGAVDADFIVNEDSIDDIKSLTELLRSSRSYSNSINLTNQKVVYAYPASFGNLTSIKDANNFDYINSYSKSIFNINGESYNIYIMKDATTINNFTQIYS